MILESYDIQFNKREALDPMTIIAVGTALVPMVDKWIGMFAKNLRCSPQVNLEGEKYGYSEIFDPITQSWSVGYQRNGKWVSGSHENETIRSARKEFRNYLHNG